MVWHLQVVDEMFVWLVVGDLLLLVGDEVPVPVVWLGAGGRRDWEKWARRNYQTALLRQSQESQEYSSGDEDFV